MYTACTRHTGLQTLTDTTLYICVCRYNKCVRVECHCYVAALYVEEGMIEVNLGGEGYDGEAWMGEVVPRQQEITQLQDEVRYLKEQCEQWKQMAEGLVPTDGGSKAPLLNREVEQLRREVEVSTCIEQCNTEGTKQFVLCRLQNNLEQCFSVRKYVMYVCSSPSTVDSRLSGQLANVNFIVLMSSPLCGDVQLTVPC